MDVKLTVAAGEHTRHACPVVVELAGEGVSTLRSGGVAVPCQSRPLGGGRCELRFVIDDLAAGASREYQATLGTPATTGALTYRDDGRTLQLLEGGQPLMAYHYRDDHAARPYWWPVPGPFGASVTRAFPMEKIDGETHDHKHHRSLWVAYGEVNHTDNWSEDPTHAGQTHQGFTLLAAGDVAVLVGQNVCWRTHLGEPVLDERRTWRVYRGGRSGEPRFIDLEVDLTPAPGVEQVLFGDTKEGGLCSVRVATSMDVPHGKIHNGAGGVDEGQCWGKRAPWCDYSGPVAGQTVGIAIFDHPTSFRHPTWWHVRNYGLMTANCFGLSHFTHNKEHGDHTLPAGTTLSFRYRLYLHAGDCAQAAVAQHYQDYATPPQITVG